MIFDSVLLLYYIGSEFGHYIPMRGEYVLHNSGDTFKLILHAANGGIVLQTCASPRA